MTPTDSTTGPTDPQLAAWCGELRLVDRAFRELTGGRTDERLKWRPGPGTWSIAECVDHLAITNAAYVTHLTPVVETARAEGRTGAGPFSFGLVGTWWVRLLSPGSRKMPAPATFAPATDVEPGLALTRFHGSQTTLIDLLVAADGLDLGRIRAPSVVTRLFRLNLAAWFAGLVAHEQRHLAQARRVQSASPA